MRLPSGFNKMDNDEQRAFIVQEMQRAYEYIDRLKKISQKLGKINSPIKVDEREDSTRLKDTHTKDA